MQFLIRQMFTVIKYFLLTNRLKKLNILRMAKRRRWGTNRLRVLRAERRLSQMDAADKARMGVNRYWRIENGYADATADERAALARVFGVLESDVFPSSEPTEASA